MSEFKFLTSIDDHDFIESLSFDYSTMKMLVMANAANVIQSCRHDIAADEDAFPNAGALAVLKRHVNWAQHGYVNALQAQVSLVFEFAKAIIAKRVIGVERSEIQMIVTCFESYRSWKTALVQDGYKKNGPGWGDGTEFNKFDWTQLNEILLARIGFNAAESKQTI